MTRQNDLKEREARIINFIRALNETAAQLNTKDTTLIAIAFVFGLLWEFIEKTGHNASSQAAELRNTRDKWTWMEGDR